MAVKDKRQFDITDNYVLDQLHEMRNIDNAMLRNRIIQPAKTFNQIKLLNKKKKTSFLSKKITNILYWGI